METVTITLDGREVSGHPGMTILELARESGVNIPTLCHDPNLKPSGACRICLVENEATGAILAACVSPIARGMTINTSSPRVLERRRMIVKLMLASHPDTCPVCDKGNRCQLRQIASDLGIGLLDLQRIPQPAVIEEVNPFIERDLSKCILCAKCIRADHELVVEGAIDYLNRGFVTRPATLHDLPLEKSECTFCGTCVALCPTGALMEKDRLGRGTTATTVETICPYCGCGCALSLELRDNHIVRARPGKDSTVNRGALCVRGSYGYDFVHSPDRLTSPLKRVNGSLVKTSWEEALSLVAAGLKKDPGSLAVLGSVRCTNEENYLLQKFARTVLGTNNIDNGSHVHGAAIGSVGSPRPSGSVSDELERSEVIVVVGANPEASAPIVSYAIKRAVKYRGARLILVDPLPTKLARFTPLWLKPRIGTDVALVNGLARVIITEGLLDKETLKNTADFEAFSQSLKKYTPAYVEKETGVPREEILQAARRLGEARYASIVYGDGVTQSNGTDGVLALANLARLKGSGLYALQRESNGRGAWEMGALPGFQPGLTAMEMMAQAREGKLKAMYIVGENPAVSFPRLSQVKSALASLDFLVVQDIFLTETAKLASVVLPAASFAEKDGTFTNFEGRAQRLHKVIEPLGESLPDWKIILNLAAAMGKPMPYNSLKEVSDEIANLAHDPPDTTESRFTTVEYKPPARAPAGYPFTLVTGSILYQFGSGSRSSRSKRLKQFCPEPFIEVGPADAQEMGLQAGDRVKVTSPAGEVTTGVKIADALPPGMLFMPTSFPESPASELFALESAERPLKTCHVRLERVATNG